MLHLLTLLLLLPATGAERTSVCTVGDIDPPAYYAIDLVTTKRVPGTRQATGQAQVTFVPSPFGIAVGQEGSYQYNLDIALEKMRPPREGVYAVWITTPDLKQVQSLGVLDDAFRIQGQVSWNKYLVVISLEPSADALGERWSGPIVLRGMSRSGMMHTMAGHGPFEQEPCAVYGY